MTVRIAENAPRLNLRREVPFVVVPSAKMQIGLNGIIPTSMAFWRSAICSTTLSLYSWLAPLAMKRLWRPRQQVPIKGVFMKSSFGVNPGWRGEVIRLTISIQPMWLQTIVEAGPSPRLGTEIYLLYLAESKSRLLDELTRLSSLKSVDPNWSPSLPILRLNSSFYYSSIGPSHSS